MEESKEERRMKETSWPTLFVVTACSCFLFSTAMKILDGAHLRFLLLLGSASLALAVISFLLKKLAALLPQKKTSMSS